MNKEKLIDKIDKLLKLSQNNTSEAEAMASAVKARELMDQYQITDMDIIARNKNIDKPYTSFCFIHDLQGFGSEYKEIPNSLAVISLSISKLNSCVFHPINVFDPYSDSKFNALLFGGLPEDVSFAIRMMQYVCASMNDGLQNFQKSYENVCQMEKRNKNLSYKEGFACGLMNKILDFLKKRDANNSKDVNALVVFKDEYIDKHFSLLKKEFKTAKELPSSFCSEAYVNGAVHSDKIDINNKIGGCIE